MSAPHDTTAPPYGFPCGPLRDAQSMRRGGLRRLDHAIGWLAELIAARSEEAAAVSIEELERLARMLGDVRRHFGKHLAREINGIATAHPGDPS